MRKKVLIFLMQGVMFLSTATFAQSIDYITCQSAEWMITFSRNAATDAADIAIFNPAGLVFLPKDGLYINSSVQYDLNYFKETFMNETYESNEPAIIPNAFFVYKKEKVAAFFAVNVTAGGGEVNWKDGDATTASLAMQTGAGAAATVEMLSPGAGGTGAISINEQYIEANSVYLGFMPGVAYKISDMASISFAVRYLVAQRSATAHADFNMDALLDAASTAFIGNETRAIVHDEFEYDASGLGAIIGFDIKPLENVLIGMRYETVTRLDFDYKMKERTVTLSGPDATLNAGLTDSITNVLAGLDLDGQKVRYDLPAVIGIGVDVEIKPGLNVMSSIDYYFIENAVWEGKGDDYSNGWDFSIGATYKVTPVLKVGAGYLYTKMGEKSSAYVNENAGLDNNSFGLGLIYSATPKLDITFSSMYTRYFSDSKDKGQATEVEYKKELLDFGAGFQYRFDL